MSLYLLNQLPGRGSIRQVISGLIVICDILKFLTLSER